MRDSIHIQKPDPDVKIWRYMDLPRFLFLLYYKKLFFSQASRLEDKFEGYVPFSDKEVFSFPPESPFREELKRIYSAPNGWRAYIAVTCWHINEEQNEAMWKIYSTGTQGIAIQSTVGRLESSLDLSAYPYTTIGKVNYGFPSPDIYPQLKSCDFFFYKPRTLDHEKELRVAIQTHDLDMIHRMGGIQINVDLNVLIETVFFAPDTPSWIVEMFRSIAKENNLSAVIHESLIHKSPFE